MAQAYVPIQTVTVGSGGSASISFTNIPQNYTDLVLKLSSRTNRADIDDILQIQPNGSSANLTMRMIRGDGSGVASGNNTTWSGGYIIGNTATSSTFGNFEAYFPNYAGSNNKSWSIDTATENNDTASYSGLFSVLWSQTTAISSLVLIPLFGTLFLQHTTATLYGIGGTRATGGTITADSNYTYHTFTSSGSFTALENIKGAEVLLVAGGGGAAGAPWNDISTGGSGAGGLLYSSGQTFNAANTYSVIVGAGGSGGSSANGTKGSNSQFSSLTAQGGGRSRAGTNGDDGGSGGGASGASSLVGGSGVSGQGNSGGNGVNYSGGGGGGAGGAGGNASLATGAYGSGGNGGIGSSTYSSWGYATSTGQLFGGIYYYAGGGGGGGYGGSGGQGGTGGAGGGGNGVSGTTTPGGSGTANTGGGGGGTGYTNSSGATGGSGGSGLVIIRYPN